MKRRKPSPSLPSEKIELATVALADGVRRYSKGSQFAYKPNAIYIGSDITDNLVSSVVAHELNHFLMHASTPYGWFLDECLLFENNVILSYCLDYKSKYPNSAIEIPLYDVARLSGEGQRFHHLLELCDKYVKPWSHLPFLRDLLEGESSQEVSAATLLVAVRTFNIIEREIEKLAVPWVEETNGNTNRRLAADPKLGERPSTPSMVLPGGREVNIGAKHIFEGIASHHESKESIVGSLKGRQRIEYWTLWMLAAMRMGAERVNSEKAYNDLLNTFYALCDLALFVPAGAVYGRLRRPSMTWYDVHPGGRFITAMTQAMKLGWIEDLETEMLPYQEWLSELVGWPSPKQFLNLGANITRTDERSRRHADACRLRLGSHSALIVLGKELDDRPENTAAENSPQPVRQFFAAHRPMVYTPALGELKLRTSENSDDELSQVLDWYFNEFNYQVTQGGSVVYEDMLPADVRYESYWSNAKSKDELIAIVSAAVPLFSPDRFKRFQVLP